MRTRIQKILSKDVRTNKTNSLRPDPKLNYDYSDYITLLAKNYLDSERLRFEIADMFDKEQHTIEHDFRTTKNYILQMLQMEQMQND